MQGPGVFANLTASSLVVTGPQGQVLVYSSAAPAANTLVASISTNATAPFTDSAGNSILPGIVNYGGSGGNFWALQMLSNAAPSLNTYHGASMAAWTAGATLTSGAGFNWNFFTDNLNFHPLSAANPQILSSTLQIDMNSDLVFKAGSSSRAAHPGTTDTAETWQPMTLANGWVNVAGFATARYELTSQNKVSVTGAINALNASAVTFFTLPAGYIPASQQPVCAAGANAAVPAGLSPWIRCDASGNLTVQNTGAIPAAFQLFFKGTIDLDA